MAIQLIIFDFDGTIADTYQAVVNITNGLSGEFGYKPIDSEAMILLKDLSSREIVKQSQISLYKLPFLARRIRTELGKQIATLKPISGIPEILIELKSQGYQMGIITSNAKQNVMAFLNQQNLSHLFDFIDSDKTIFGKHRIIKKYSDKYRVDRANIVYVGDETRDIRSARKSRVSAIAVDWGFNSAQILSQYEPDFLASTPTEILDAIEKLNFNSRIKPKTAFSK